MNTSSAHTSAEEEGIESANSYGPLEFKWNFSAPLSEKIVIIYMMPTVKKMTIDRDRFVTVE